MTSWSASPMVTYRNACLLVLLATMILTATRCSCDEEHWKDNQFDFSEDVGVDDADVDTLEDTGAPDVDEVALLTLHLEGTARQDLNDDNEPVSVLRFDFDCQPECEFHDCLLAFEEEFEESIDECESPVTTEVYEEGAWTFSVAAEKGDQRQEASVTVITSLRSFITHWDTAGGHFGNPNPESRQITLPLVEDGEYNFVVEWGDGTSDVITEWDQPEVTHTYPEAGEYTVVIHGQIDGWLFAGEGDRRKILELRQWGPLRLGEHDGGYFRGATVLDLNAEDAPDLSGTTTMARAFESCCRGGVISGDLSHWDVSNITDMHAMFRGVSYLDADIGDWDVSNVEDMSQMFSDTHNNTSEFDVDISGWDVSSLVNAEEMFAFAESFDRDLSGWETSSLQNMRNMFLGARQFSADLSEWDVSNVTDMRGSFVSTSISGGLETWDVSNVTDMGFMFYRTDFNGDISQWDVSNVESMNEMFSGATEFNADLSEWDVSKVSNMNHMFTRAESFDRDLRGWDVSNVIGMRAMFREASSFDRDLSDWEIRSVADMEAMFDDSDLSDENYDSMLISWSAQDVQSDVLFSAGSAVLTSVAGEEARDFLVQDRGWVIEDGQGIHSSD